MKRALIISGIILLVALGLFFIEHAQAPTEENNQTETSTLDEDFAIAAIQRIKALPEVQTWMAEIDAKSKGRAVVTLDNVSKNIYTIHVYEDLPERIVTFNWYDVDNDTGEVISAMPF